MTTRGISAWSVPATYNFSVPTIASGVMTGTVSTPFYVGYYYNITDNAVNNDAAAENNGVLINYAIHGGKGAKTALNVIASFDTTTSTAAGLSYYTALFPKMYVSKDDGGTGTSIALSKGYFYGLGAGVFAQSGATNLAAVSNEVDVSMSTGSSAAIKTGWCVIGGGLGGTLDNIAGTVHDSLYSCTTDSDTNVKYRLGFSFGREDSYWPIKSTGTIIGTSAPIAGSRTAADGVDFSGVTFSGSAFKSTGFTVSGSGALTATYTTLAAAQLLVSLRDTNVAVTAGGLHRLTANGSGAFSWQVNTAAGGDFSAAINAWKTTSTGQLVLFDNTAIPAGGTAGTGLSFSTTANFGVFFGSGAPSLVAAKGSLYLRSDGSSTSTRMYVATDSAGTWTNVTTAA